MPLSFFERAALACLLISSSGCAIFATRPVQEMSYAAAALRAAREVQSETLSPDQYRRAQELFEEAKKEYLYKDFYQARSHANQARVLAEKAELNSLLSGGLRKADTQMPDPLAQDFQKSPDSRGGNAQKSSSEPYAYPTPTPVPASDLESASKEPPRAR